MGSRFINISTLLIYFIRFKFFINMNPVYNNSIVKLLKDDSVLNRMWC